MASIDKFNDHCWRDVIPQADLELYSGWRRETFVGARPAMLAIDLYDLVYRGGPHSPYELNARYPNSCGIYAHRAIAPTSLIVCGESTSGCVRASVVDGYSNGFHVSVVEECTYDRAELTHKVNLFDLHHKYADVMHVEEVVA